MRRMNNVYPMTEEKWFKKSLSRKTKFRKYGKGLFCITKKDFRAETLFAERNRVLADDGSAIEPNIYNKRQYRRIKRFYPFY